MGIGNGGFQYVDPVLFSAADLNKANPGGIISKVSDNVVAMTERRVPFQFIEEFWPAKNDIAIPDTDGIYYISLPVTNWEGNGVADFAVVDSFASYDWEKTQLILARVVVANGVIASIEQINEWKPAVMRWIQVSEPGLAINLVSETPQKVSFDPANINILNGKVSNQSDPFWDNANSKFTPKSIQDNYMIRVNALVDPTQSNRSLIISLDIGGSQGEILSSTNRLIRGAGNNTKVSKTDAVFVGSTFLANGGEFIIECDSDAVVTELSILISRFREGVNL